MAFDLAGQRQQTALGEVLADERLRREQPGNAGCGGRAEAARQRDVVAHLDAHHRRLEAVLLQAVLEADQESVARIEADLVAPLTLHGERLGAARRAATP